MDILSMKGGRNHGWFLQGERGEKMVGKTIRGVMAKTGKTGDLQYKTGTQWKTFLDDTRIGADYSKTFEPITARQVRLNILESTDGPTIREFQLVAPKSGGK